MKKFLSVLMLAVLLVVVTGCTKPVEEVERTYKADGTYMAWKFNTSSNDLLMPDGTAYKNAADAKVKVNTPVLTTVTVQIVGDKIVKYFIDELQSQPYVSTPRGSNVPNVDEDGNVTEVTWKWNEQTKRELEYGYGMEFLAPKGEFYIQALALENHWLKTGVINDETAPLTAVTIHFNDFALLAKEAVQKAKDGKVSAITDKEHYTYDVTYATGDINAEGKISNIALNAHLFGNVGENTYKAAHADYLKFAWNAKDKYASYPPMTGDKMWQDQIDTMVSYINANGWDGSILSGQLPAPAGNPTKGLNKFGEAVEVLSTVTQQTYREVLVMNMLLEFFPRGWN